MAKLSLVVAESAKADLDNIFCYISKDSPNAASKLVYTIEQQFCTLLEFPNIGFKRPDITKRDVRFCIVADKYQAVYYIKNGKLIAQRVLSDYQNIPKII